MPFPCVLGAKVHVTQGALELHLLASASQMLGTQGHTTTPGLLEINLLSSMCPFYFNKFYVCRFCLYMCLCTCLVPAEARVTDSYEPPCVNVYFEDGALCS